VPTWGELLKELEQIQASIGAIAGQTYTTPTAFDVLRRKYLADLSAHTKRATITYYSGFLDNPDLPASSLSVSPQDISGLMEACSNAKERDLDLFLHSPGGDPDAAEQMCAYLRTQFDHIRVVVPVIAMSAATMIALSADEVVMGAHSQLGPIDPQLTIRTPEGPRSASAQAIKDQFALAIEDCKDPTKLTAWIPILRSYAPGLLATCDHASLRATNIVETALARYMFGSLQDGAAKAHDTAEWFGNASAFLSHAHPVRRDEARDHDVVVIDLEADAVLQDKVLSVHHAALITLSGSPTAKLIENHHGRAWVKRGAQQVQFAFPVQQAPALPAGPAKPGANRQGPGRPRRRK
jgi:hypothetical protein